MPFFPPKLLGSRFVGKKATAPTILAIAVALAVATRASAARGGGDSWTKALEKRGIDPAVVSNPIEITPEIKSAADRLAGGGGGTVDQLHRIQDALFDAGRFTFDYDAKLTYTAAEALAARRGNCVAFTNLFIAMARARGLSVRAGFLTPRSIGEKRGDLIVVSTHVVAVYQLHDRAVVFDFYRTREDPTLTIRLLDDFELAGLYLNNRAVEALGDGDLVTAERRLDAVVALAPKLAPAHGNLGVLRRRRGNIEGAFDAYRHALALEPHDPAILGNLASLYIALGMDREAKDAIALADLGRATPYTILARGDLEAADGRLDDARRHYRRAARLAPKIPEPQVALARLAVRAGKPDEARRAAEHAIKIDPENADARAILATLGAGTP